MHFSANYKAPKLPLLFLRHSIDEVLPGIRYSNNLIYSLGANTKMSRDLPFDTILLPSGTKMLNLDDEGSVTQAFTPNCLHQTKVNTSTGSIDRSMTVCLIDVLFLH